MHHAKICDIMKKTWEDVSVLLEKRKFWHNKRKLRIFLLIAIALVVFAGIVFGGIALSNRLQQNKDDVYIAFLSPDLTGSDSVLLSASGTTKRSVTAHIYNADGEILEDRIVQYRLEEEMEGVVLQKNILTFDSNLIHKSTKINLIATEANPMPGTAALEATLKIQVKQDKQLQDVAPNPPEKEGWVLFYQDEFEAEVLNYSKWSPYYLRHWTNYDARTQASYYFENGSLVLSCVEDGGDWSPQDKKNVSGIMSAERNHLHKFGEVDSGAVYNRDIPNFEGFATKYGYFEIRARLPDTRDGSHFAWWMVGMQDDMNDSARLSGQESPYSGFYTNEAGEFDILENALGGLKEMKAWRPVIHPNGTQDYEYLWVPEYTIPGDPAREYHIYAFEWDETGTKFYVDNQLAAQTDRTPNYRMMTIFSVYAQGGMGDDRGIYPKDTYIDYFRVYKQDKAPRPTSVALNGGATPDFVAIPETGSSTVKLQAQVLDQFDQANTAKVKWRLSETVAGTNPQSSAVVQVPGVTIQEDTGVLTIQSSVKEDADIFVTAYVNNDVKQTYHIKATKTPSAPRRILFAGEKTIAPGAKLSLEARLYDQFMQAQDVPVQYRLVTDISGAQEAKINGVSVGQDGVLQVQSAVPPGTVIIVQARAAGKTANHIVTVA